MQQDPHGRAAERLAPRHDAPAPGWWAAAHLDALVGERAARMLVDRDSKVVFASATCRELLELSDGRGSLIDITAPEDLQVLLAHLAGDVGWRCDVTIRSAAGRPARLRLSSLARPGGVWAVEVTAADTRRTPDAALLDVATALLEADGDIDDVLRKAVERFGEDCAVDRAAVFVYDTRRPPAEGSAYMWARPGVSNPVIDADWWVSRLSGGSGSTSGLLIVDDALRHPDGPFWLERDTTSVLAVKSSIGGGYDVTVGVSLLDTTRRWSEHDVDVLRSAAAIFGNAVRRAQSEAALRGQRDALEASEERLRSTIDAMPAVIYRIDRDTRVLLANAEAARFGEIPADALVGLRLVDFVDRDVGERLIADVGRLFDTGEPIESSLNVRTPARGEVWFDSRGVPEFGPDGRVESMLLFAIDTTARRAMESQIRRSAEIDSLTGLANRSSLLRGLERLLEEAPEAGTVAVLFVDLDRFKLTNDSLGHTAGDVVLQGVAGALMSCADDGDIVARLGGDEFAVALVGVRDIIDAVRRVERVRRAIAKPIDVGAQSVLVTASIGVALVSQSDRSPGDLLRLADVAMYQAKVRGRNRFEIFDDNLRSEVEQRIDTEAALRRAVPDRQLEVHYQPEVMLESGRLVGLEALVRWRHPQRGLLLPGAFIVLAEESGLIADIGRVVLNDACRQVGEWARSHPELPLTVRVNVSGRQLTQAGLLDDVTVALAEASLAPERLCLEITETALMTDLDTSIRMLRAIRELGVTIAIDDFGTGYSSLGYLERFPIDALKIDRSFVSGLGTDAKSAAIVRTLMSLAHVLELDVVAEGVETDGQAAMLKTLGCSRAQGFLYAPGLEAAEIERLLDDPFLSPGGRRFPV